MLQPPAEMELWLVRHARPVIAPGICYGSTDVAADATHTTQSAARLWRALNTEGAASNSTTAHTSLQVWASPLQRAQTLAQALHTASGHTLHWHTDVRLAEMDFGHWEGRAWADLGAEAFAPWMDNFAHHRVGGGDSVAHFMARVEQAWQTTLQHGRIHGHHRAVWLTHAGVIRAMRLWHQDITCPTTAQDWPAAAPSYGEWTVLRFNVTAGATSGA